MEIDSSDASNAETEVEGHNSDTEVYELNPEEVAEHQQQLRQDFAGIALGKHNRAASDDGNTAVCLSLLCDDCDTISRQRTDFAPGFQGPPKDDHSTECWW